MSEFIAMGGYAAFVWGSYAAGVAVFAWNLWAARAQAREFRRRAQAGSGDLSE